MAESKTYLNVPYPQKDAAKALGARWDASQKKWYVPADKDAALFAQWQTEPVPLAAVITGGAKVRASYPKTSPTVKNPALGVVTYAEDKNFVAYNGDAPPWD